MDDHIPLFLCPKKEFNSTIRKKKNGKIKKLLPTPRPSLSRPVHLKYPPEPVELVAILALALKWKVLSHYPIPCTRDSLI